MVTKTCRLTDPWALNWIAQQILSIGLPALQSDLEESSIEWALMQTRGNITQAALLLRIQRTSLNSKLAKYGISASKYGKNAQ